MVRILITLFQLLVLLLTTMACGIDSRIDESFSGSPDNPSQNPPTFCELQEETTVDSSFAEEGFFQLDLDNQNNTTKFSSSRVAFDSAGRIYTVGFTDPGSYHHVTLVRLTSSGVLDTTFGDQGVVLFDLGSEARGHAISIHNDEVFVSVSGTVGNKVIKTDLSGDLITSFGTNGVASNPNSSSHDGLYVSSNGDIYTTGHRSGPTDLTATKFLSDGAIDSSFASSGYLQTNLAGNEFGHFFTFNRNEDKFYMVSERIAAGRKISISRFNLDGTYDNSFATNGNLLFDYNGDQSVGRGMAINASGDHFMLGSKVGGHALISKASSAGVLDSTWGNNGIIEYIIGDSSDIHEMKFLGSLNYAFFRTSIGGVDQLALGQIKSDGQLDLDFADSGILLIPWPENQSAQFINSKIDSQGRLVLAFEVHNGVNKDLGLMRICP